jgi:hypothetical protein
MADLVGGKDPLSIQVGSLGPGSSLKAVENWRCVRKRNTILDLCGPERSHYTGSAVPVQTQFLGASQYYCTIDNITQDCVHTSVM